MAKKIIPKSDAALLELPSKLSSEKRLNRKLRTIFNKIGKDAVQTMKKTGLAPDITNYQNQLAKIIEKDSAITGKKFSKQLRKKLKLGTVGNGIINNDITQYVSKTSFEQAGHIIATTQKRLDDTVEKVFKDFAKIGTEPDREQVAAVLNKDFKKINRNRTKSIAANEVQRVSEKSKLIEAETLTRIKKIKNTSKRWDAILDTKTRPFHARADAQIVPIDSPFTVGGELMMQPGDASLGASLGNLINCRCSVQFLADAV